MKMTLNIIDERIIDYSAMLEKQLTVFSQMVEKKKRGTSIENEHIFLLEHYPVITLGKHAKESNILIDDSQLKNLGISMFHIERGGDVTYHGPGQLIAYPILDLEAHHLGVKDYVSLLEEVVIRTLAHFGIQGERVSGASGVWIGAGTPHERKICALGVKCSRYITMHGLALNVNTDLTGFHLINPCGFVDKGVTSLAIETGKTIDINLVKQLIANEFRMLLGYDK